MKGAWAIIVSRRFLEKEKMHISDPLIFNFWHSMSPSTPAKTTWIPSNNVPASQNTPFIKTMFFWDIRHIIMPLINTWGPRYELYQHVMHFLWQHNETIWKVDVKIAVTIKDQFYSNFKRWAVKKKKITTSYNFQAFQIDIYHWNAFISFSW